MAKGKVMASVSIDFDAETDKLNKKTDEVNKRLARMEKNNKSFSKNIKGGFIAITGAVAAAGGAIKLFKGIMASTQATGDAMVHRTASWKAGLESVYENIATLDIKNIGTDWRNATSAAYLYSEALDDIGDKSLAMEIRRSEGMLATISKRYEIEKALNEERYSDAIKLNDENKALAQSLLDDEKALLKDKEDAWDAYYMKRKGADQEQIDNLKWVIENYDYLGDEMAKVNELQLKASGKNFWAGKEIGWIRISKAAREDAQDQLDNLTGQEKRYASIWSIYNEMTDEKRQEYAAMAVEGNTLQQKQVKLLKTAEAQEKTITAQLEKQVALKKKLVASETSAISGNTGNQGAHYASFDALMQGKHNDIGGTLVTALPTPEDLEVLNTSLQKTQNLAYGITDAFSMMMGVIGQSIEEGKIAWADFALSAIGSIKSVIMELIALTIYKVLAAEAGKGPVGLLIGLAAGAMALTAASALIKKGQSEKYHTGGIVPGSNSNSERYALVNPGEMYLTRQDQSRLYNGIKTGNFGGSGSGQWEVANVKVGFDAFEIGMMKNRTKKMTR